MKHEKTASAAERLKEELIKYGVVSGYLFICFSILLLYVDSQEAPSTISTLPFGMAAVKALVIGKFILIGDALSVGARAEGHPLLHRVAWKSMAMLLLLMLFHILEEVIVGLVHDKSVAEVFKEFAAQSWLQISAPVLLMLLVIIPLIGATELFRALGREEFQKLIEKA